MDKLKILLSTYKSLKAHYESEENVIHPYDEASEYSYGYDDGLHRGIINTLGLVISGLEEVLEED